VARAQSLPDISDLDLFETVEIDMSPPPVSKKKAAHRITERRRYSAKVQEKRFVAWDGEGVSVPNGTPQPYILFGNTDGQMVTGRQLDTKTCLDLILDADRTAINFGFAFGYDINQILVDLPPRALQALARNNQCRWDGYIIEHIPHKWFSVRRKDRKRVKIFDVFNFFNCALVTNDPERPGALDRFNIGTPAERKYLAEQKKNRPDFTWDELKDIIKYWGIEGRLMVELMEYMRDLFAAADYFPKSWHGPAVLGRELLRNNDIKSAMCDTRAEWPEVWIASRYAFAAGRFQQWLAGLYEGPVFNYDVNSAYPYAMQFLPNLATGVWKRVPRRDLDRSTIHRERFCLYHIKFNGSSGGMADHGYSHNNRPRPLFRRNEDGIYWPKEVENWYWSPEAELVKNDPDAEFVEAWEYVDDGTRPFAFIAQTYKIRQAYKKAGNSIQEALKLSMNSVFGQFAGWQSMRPPGPPQYHQLEWAGFLTSMCRAMVHKVATYAWSKGGLVTIDTDGVLCTVEVPEEILPNGIGSELGQWGKDEYDGLLVWQNGFYWMHKDDKWVKARSRGAPRGTVPIELALNAIKTGEKFIEFDKVNFMGYKLCNQQRSWQYWRSWKSSPQKVEFGSGSNKSKMMHHPRMCRVCVQDSVPQFKGISNETLHTLANGRHTKHIREAMATGKPISNWSQMHYLPWLDPDANKDEDALIDFADELEIWEEVG
jgi:hypothetical protein